MDRPHPSREYRCETRCPKPLAQRYPDHLVESRARSRRQILWKLCHTNQVYALRDHQVSSHRHVPWMTPQLLAPKHPHKTLFRVFLQFGANFAPMMDWKISPRLGAFDRSARSGLRTPVAQIEFPAHLPKVEQSLGLR